MVRKQKILVSTGFVLCWYWILFQHSGSRFCSTFVLFWIFPKIFVSILLVIPLTKVILPSIIKNKVKDPQISLFLARKKKKKRLEAEYYLKRLQWILQTTLFDNEFYKISYNSPTHQSLLLLLFLQFEKENICFITMTSYTSSHFLLNIHSFFASLHE